MPNYISFQHNSGNGNSSNAITCAANPTTGRNGRSGTFTVRTTSQSKSIVINVEQAGKDLFASTPQGSYNVGASGGTYSFNITTNVRKLLVVLDNNSPITITGLSYSGTQGTINSGGKSANIQPNGDPGASAQYVVAFIATIPATQDIGGGSYDLIIKDYDSDTELYRVSLNQSGAAEDLKVKNSNNVYFQPDGNATTITFPASGGTDTISVISNTNWEIVNPT